MLRGKDAPYGKLSEFVLDLESPFEGRMEDIEQRDEEELGIQNKARMQLALGM